MTMQLEMNLQDDAALGSQAEAVYTPAIRFKGFSGAWEVNALEHNASFSKGRGYSKGDLVESGNPIILYGRLYTKYQIAISEIDTFVKELSNSIFSNGNEVIVPASGETAEDISRASAVLMSGIVLGGDLNIVHPNEKINSIFLALTLSNGKPQKNLSKKAQGKSVVHLRNNDLKEIEIPYPNIEEQTAIGNYFQQLDSLIAQHQHKHTKLLNLKQALLQKMFPKQGATVPEVRFKGFSGDWVISELGKILDITSAARVHKDEWADTGVPFFRTSDVVSIYKGQENKKAYISYDLYKELVTRTGAVKKNDLLITGGGSIGIPYLVNTNEPLYFKDADLLWLKNNTGTNGYFLFTFFSSPFFIKYKNSISHIGTISHYTIEQAKTTPISLSKNSEEQTKIGQLFQQLDHLITQQHALLTKLGNLKQAYLAKMFI